MFICKYFTVKEFKAFYRADVGLKQHILHQLVVPFWGGLIRGVK